MWQQYHGNWGILVMQYPQMIFSRHSCIILNPEQLQVFPDPPLGGCFSDDGRRCNNSNYHHSNDPRGPNAQTCNATATNYATWTARDAWQTQGEKQVQREGVCWTRDFMSHLQPAPYHPSHQAGMQHTSSSVSGHWSVHQKGLCVFPDLAKPHIKTQN